MASAAAAAEQVSISAAGQMLTTASAQNAAASDARIAQLQAAIQSGSYTVDPQRIARGLLQDSQSLLAASRPAAKTGSAR
jgi:negative regulator of flagellin synthesis FlgM